MNNTAKIDGIVELTYRENNILYFRMAEKSTIDIDAAKKILELASNLSNNLDHCNLVDIRKMTFMSGDARKYFGQQNKSSVKAVAILANPKLHKPLINLYLKFSRPTLPTRQFDTEEEALIWLNTFN
ncbi:MAG: STAS/SEC14 domain-containing protein [Bacteroidales bacterium]|nr:STAS/SEC14 domain-containing protein [Bacteroidales bacterium]MBN2818372.1 STAS/SEC14 domain-containing protein [Bacteroidales bacterium]